MSKISAIFRPLDEFIFRQVDQLKSSGLYGKISEKMSTLDEGAQKAINHVVTILAISIPLLLILFFLFQNLEKRNELSVKKEINDSISTFLRNQEEIATQGTLLISAVPLKSESELKGKISALVSTRGLNTENISFSNFKQEPQGKNFELTSVDLIFKKFTIQQFTDLSTALLRGKFKFQKVKIEKESDTIKGSLSLLYYNRMATDKK